MDTRQALVFVFILLSISAVSNAYSLPEVNSLLASYNVPGSLISTLQPVPLSYAGNQYLGMYNDSYPHFIINLTGSYSIVLNSTAIYNIIRNYTITTSLSKANFTLLNSQMQLYKQASSGPLTDCLVETGLNTGATCTVQNNCQSCLFVPLCRCDLTGTNCPPNLPASSVPPGGGVTGYFGKGIIQFASAYATLNSSYNTFLSSTNSTNLNNVLQNLARINSAYANISNISYSISHNPIFPPSANVTPNQIAGCASYVNQSIAPWYCSSIGYCENTNFNYTKLAYIGYVLGNINLLPLTNTQIFSLAFNVSANESTYAYPILSKERLAMLNKTLSKTAPDYAALVNDSAILLSHVSNATLKAQLNALMDNYDNITSNYFYTNFSKANITLATQYAGLEATYQQLNRTYSDVISLAENNTAHLIEIQLSSYVYASPQITNLALAQLALNGQISLGGLTNLSLLDQQLRALAAQINTYPTSPLTLNNVARAIDSPFIRSFSSALGLSYASAVASAPFVGALLSLIIGIALISLLFFARFYLETHHRLVSNSRTRQNWKTVFIILGAIVLVYFLATWYVLAGANARAPFGAFQSAYRSSGYVVVAINGTPTLNELTCASKISQQAISQNKTAVVAMFNNGLCTVSNNTQTVDSCLNFYGKTNIPVIVLTNSSRSGLSLYSLYGTVLRVSGNSTVMNDCYVSLLLNR